MFFNMLTFVYCSFLHLYSLKKFALLAKEKGYVDCKLDVVFKITAIPVSVGLEASGGVGFVFFPASRMNTNNSI